MNKSIKYYNQWSILAALIFLLLVSLQMVWVIRAVKFQEREIIHELKEVVNDVAMEINSIDHDAFHGELNDLPLIPTSAMTQKVDDYLASKNIFKKTYFAIFQDTVGGVFRSNKEEYKDAFFQSEVRACMTCISSFSTIAKKDMDVFDVENMDMDSIQILSTFQYYSPVKGLKKKSGETLWLALYQPYTLSTAIKSLIYLFAVNIFLLIVLLGMFYILLKSLSRHKQLTKVKDDFFNNMTHEFKTPLSSIRLASKVLREHQDPVKRITYHDIIEKESKSLEQQIDKLLELSLLDDSEIKLDKKPVDLCDLVHEIPQKLKLLLDDKSGKLHIDCQLKERNFVGDAYHLLNSFCNLVENSLKYSQTGVIIKISAFQKENNIFISVKDNGPGIQEQHRSNIFSRFYRGQRNNEYKGVGFGIGLSYVKSIVEAHDGKITLNPAYEVGTEFIIKL